MAAGDGRLASDRPAPAWKIAAGIVAFHPDTLQLMALVEAIAPEVARIFVFLNSGIADELRARLEGCDGLRLIEADTNLGVGAALNIVALAAAWERHDFVVLFDQDSAPAHGTVSALVAAHRELVAAGQAPAVVAPLLVSKPGSISKPPRYLYQSGPAVGAARAVAFVPTSGSLIGLDRLRRIGFFRADYFIDGIDLEWSFRASSQGTSCWVLTDRTMQHAVGTGVIAWPWLRFTMPRQRPFRMYCLVRNTVFGLRLRHVPLAWKAKQVAYLLVQMFAYALHHGFAPAVVRQLAAGVADGLRGRLGVPPGLPSRS